VGQRAVQAQDMNGATAPTRTCPTKPGRTTVWRSIGTVVGRATPLSSERTALSIPPRAPAAPISRPASQSSCLLLRSRRARRPGQAPAPRSPAGSGRIHPARDSGAGRPGVRHRADAPRGCPSSAGACGGDGSVTPPAQARGSRFEKGAARC
jgi:hypothetical protein